ncbi:GNAT family N-acetyltransferase [Bradyrhizobium japonicum]|uniref:GNAT family N-acetyltransferase n=1 Tax=Bradyrhizobium japonicum TaxID=375 RepID=UPI00200D106B|nr:GNAT family N-acetyltransferase [Bradyrhizobium japonicum]UQD96106.1 GNAT family N-acetyltransferase [Bradyrhizobium japonicum]
MNIAARALKTSTPHIELRLAKKDDVATVVPFLAMFFARSRWAENLAFDSLRAESYLSRAIPSGYAIYILALDGERLVGLCSYHMYNVFTDPVGVMDETYVVPELRRSDLGCRLVHLALHLAKGEGCKVMNFPVASGMYEQRSLINMLVKRFGCEPMGLLLRKVL